MIYIYFIISSLLVIDFALRVGMWLKPIRVNFKILVWTSGIDSSMLVNITSNSLRGGEEIKPWFVALANFHDINTPPIANFELPTWGC